MNEILARIKAAAIASTTCPRRSCETVNGHTVEACVAEGYRNGGRNKVSIRWSVDGKIVAAANLAKVLA